MRIDIPGIEQLPKKLVVWCLLRDQFGHVKPVEEYFGSDAEFVYDADWDPTRLVNAAPDIVVCVNDFHFDVVRCLDAARDARIPSLVIQDGILEWRCQYENPKFAAGNGPPQHQPVMADKIACIGFQSARNIASWGNVAKVEITGMPRLDYIRNVDKALPHNPLKRILIMTAKKPGFTPEQTAITVKSLSDLKAFFDKMPEIEVIWRITKGLDKELRVENHLSELNSQSLVEVLKVVDAVISTPSTAMLESMLMLRPVACLDYHNTPQFVQTAWRISARDHISDIVNEILNPSPPKLEFQDQCLRDALMISDKGSAAERVAQLMQLMAKVGQLARDARTDLLYENNIIGNIAPDLGVSQPRSLAEFYPEHLAFRLDDLVELQLRYARLLKDHEYVRNMLNQRTIGYWLQRIVHKVTKPLQ